MSSVFSGSSSAPSSVRPSKQKKQTPAELLTEKGLREILENLNVDDVLVALTADEKKKIFNILQPKLEGAVEEVKKIPKKPKEQGITAEQRAKVLLALTQGFLSIYTKIEPVAEAKLKEHINTLEHW